MPEQKAETPKETTPATPVQQVEIPATAPITASTAQREKTMGELMGVAHKPSSNVYISLFFNCAKSHSVPYSLKPGTDNVATQWAMILPGITTSIHFDVWERIKDHPDIKNFLEMGTLRVIGEAPDLDNAHDFHGIKAISQGALTRGIYEPIPVQQVKQHSISANPRLIP